MPSAKIVSKPTKAKPEAVVEIDPTKADVGDLAKAAAAAETPHRAKGAPEAALVLPAQSLKAGAVKKALQDVKGVDAKASTVKGGNVQVKLSDKGGAKLADIKKALAGAK